MDRSEGKRCALGLTAAALYVMINFYWLPNIMTRAQTGALELILLILTYIYLGVQWINFSMVDEYYHPWRLLLWSTELHLSLYLCSYQPLIGYLFLTLFVLGVFWGRVYLKGQEMPVPVFQYRFRHFVKSIGVVVLFVPAVSGLVLGCSPVLEGKLRLWKCGLISEEAAYDKLCQLDYDKWKILSEQEKLEILQLIHCREAKTLGMDAYPVYAEEQEDTWGYWDIKQHRISLNKEMLETTTSMKCVETLLHETRHAYQHYNIDLWENGKPTFEKEETVLRWAAASESYQSDREDSQLAYYCNGLEVDARDFASDRYWIYTSRNFSAAAKG